MIGLEELLCVSLLVPIGDPDVPLTSHRVIWGLPVKLEGLSGIGKTSRLKSICTAVGIVGHPVFAGTKQPEDFAGVFVPMADGSVTVSPVLVAAKRCIDAGGGCIILDEVNTASERTQAALLSFVDERRIGDQAMPNRTRFLLAMNPTEYAAGGTPLTAALANRLSHLFVDPPRRTDWTGWLQGEIAEVISVPEGEQLIIARWGDHWPQVLGLATSFMQRSPDEVLHKQPKPDAPESACAWPSPRTWYMGLRAITTARCLGDRLIVKLPAGASAADVARARKTKLEQLQHELLKSLVGEGPAAAWAAWVTSADLPSIEDMLAGKWRPDTKRLDRTHAALTSLVEHTKSRSKEEQQLIAAPTWAVLLEALKLELSDIVLPAARTLHRAGINRQNIPACKAPCEEVIYELSQSGFMEFA